MSSLFCVRARVHIHRCTHTDAHRQVHIQVHTHRCTQTGAHTGAHTQVYTQVRTHRCIHRCTHTQVYTQVHTQVHMHTCDYAGHRTVLVVITKVQPTFLSARSPSNLELIKYTRLASFMDSPVSISPGLGLHAHVTMPGFFFLTCVLGIRLISLYLQSRHCIN